MLIFAVSYKTVQYCYWIALDQVCAGCSLNIVTEYFWMGMVAILQSILERCYA